MSRPLPDAATVAKAFTALRHDARLSPADRGALMISLSETADAVFKAEHPTVTKIDAALRLLEGAKQRHHGVATDRLIESLIAAINRGEVHDNLALESRLREIRAQLTKEKNDER
jgi:hypothetical protein